MPKELQNRIDSLKQDLHEATKTAHQTRVALTMLLDGLSVYFDDRPWVNRAESEKAVTTKQLVRSIRDAWKSL